MISFVRSINLTLPLVIKDLALFEKGPEKGPEKRPDSKANEIENRIQQVYALIKENPKVSRAEIGRLLGISDKQSKTAIEILKNRGIIHREGSARSGSWIVDNEVSP